MALDGRRGPGPKPAPERRSPSVPGAQPYDRERFAILHELLKSVLFNAQ